MRDGTVYLATVLDSVDRIQEYVEGLSSDEFLRDNKTQDAVIRNLEVIGQALKDYGIDHLTEMDSSIPWHKISGLRNVLAHQYLGVDMILLWETVQQQLDDLKIAVEKIMRSSDQ